MRDLPYVRVYVNDFIIFSKSLGPSLRKNSKWQNRQAQNLRGDLTRAAHPMIWHHDVSVQFTKFLVKRMTRGELFVQDSSEFTAVEAGSFLHTEVAKILEYGSTIFRTNMEEKQLST